MRNSWLARVGLALGLSLSLVPLSAAAKESPGLSGARAWDARVNVRASYEAALAARPGSESAGHAAASAIARQIATDLLARRSADAQLDVALSNLTGAPETVYRNGGLTAVRTAGTNVQVVRDWLEDAAALYGLTPADRAGMAVVGDSAGGDGGLRMLRLEQRIDGRPVFESETRFTIDVSGRLVKSVGQFVPDAEAAAFRGGKRFELGAPEAIVRLLGSTGYEARAASFGAAADRAGQQELSESDDHVAGAITARQVYFPVAPGVLVPAWSLVVFTEGAHDWYGVVDAVTGAVLWRKDMRSNASVHQARFRVYVQADGVTPADSPAPASPNAFAVGSGTQPAEIAPTIVQMSTAQNITASPNGWINDCVGACTVNETQTIGNNTVTCMDFTGTADVCDTAGDGLLDGNGRPTGNADANGRNRDFLGTTTRDFQTNYLPPPQGGNPETGQQPLGTGAAQTSFRRGMATHLFYLTNWYHDRLFTLGFDEGAANFQQTNIGGSGLGNDRVLGEAQDGSGTNNANFSTPPDGTSGRMQMYVFDGPTIDRDGSLDAEIVLHELTHGTSNRLVGNGNGLIWDPGAGMGEGWSDFYALSLLNNTNADTPTARYASGAYATYKLASPTVTDNYIYGIRRFPYSTDNTLNPLTWADVDDVTNDLGGGMATSPLNFNGGGAAEVHNVGEIWAQTLWEVRARVIADPAGANGNVPTGNTTMLRLVTDALKLTPISPGYTEARDALLQADCASNACANENWIWQGFADRGLGYGARAPYRYVFGLAAGHAGVQESFRQPYLDMRTVASDIVVNDAASNNNGALDPGEAVRLNVRLFNPWRAASRSVASATAVLTSSTPGVAIVDGTASWGAIAAQGNALSSDSFTVLLAPGLACGSRLRFTLAVTSTLGTTIDEFDLRVGTASGTDAVITYTGDPNPNLAIPDATSRGVLHQLRVNDDRVISDINFRVDSLTHTWTGDLTVMLRAPSGTGVDLIGLIGAVVTGNDSGDNLTNMVIDDDVANTNANDMAQALNTAAPFTKSWRPVFDAAWPPLAGFGPTDPITNLARMDGESTLGLWSVLAADDTTGDTGTLNAWSIAVTPVHFNCAAFSYSGQTNTTITSDLPDASEPFATVPVRVAVRENPAFPQPGEPSGTVFVHDGPVGDPLTASCVATLAGTVGEVGQCNLTPRRTGAKTLTAVYSGGSNWQPSQGQTAHAVRALRIVKTRPAIAHTGQQVTVAIDLGLIVAPTPAPTGTVTITDGSSSCSIVLPASECQWSAASAGLRQLQATYPGDANYAAMTSPKVNLQVGPDRYPELLPIAVQTARDSYSSHGLITLTPLLSADGRFLVFESPSLTLTPDDRNGITDIFRYDVHAGTMAVVSTGTGGTTGNGSSNGATLSADGRYVGFVSSASDLVAGDSNGVQDAFVRDMVLGTTSRVSLTAGGAQLPAATISVCLSSDGRFAGFYTNADGVVPGDTNGFGDTFVRDLQTGQTTRVTLGDDGAQPNAVAAFCNISSDGRIVAFRSAATNLVRGDTNAFTDVFARDLLGATTERISISSVGGQANGDSFQWVMDQSGRYIAFNSFATNLVSGDTNANADVFLRDRLTGSTRRVSVSSAGVEGNGGSFVESISADGRYITFQSSSTNLVAGDTNALTDIFLFDTVTATTERINLGSGGVQANAVSFTSWPSADGRYVLFSSSANNLVAGDLNVGSDLFIRDRTTAATARVSIDSAGQQADRASVAAAIASDGSRIAFESASANLVASDANGVADIFARTPASSVLSRASVDSAGVEANAASSAPALSGNGRYVLYVSAATNLVAGDTNGLADIFRRDLQTNTTARISVTGASTQATGGASAAPAASSTGDFIAFDSAATNLVTDTNALTDVFVRDVVGATTTRVSVNTAGTQATGGASTAPDISSTGRYVVFQSAATNLIGADGNAASDIFLRDTCVGAGGCTVSTIRVSVDTAGAEVNGASTNAVISSTGRYVAFQSAATNLVAGDTNGVADVFVRDTCIGAGGCTVATTRFSLDSGGGQANFASTAPAISADGQYVLFTSTATNLVAGDTNGVADVFVRSLAGVTQRLSLSASGAQAVLASGSSRFGLANNGFVVFDSASPGLAAGDDNAQGDALLTRIPAFNGTGATTTAITSDTPDPSVVNSAFTVNVSVTRVAGASDVTGTVVITDGSESCTATLSGSGATATGSCALTSERSGALNLVATYSGDANYAPSVSANVPHTVTAAPITGFVVSGDSPDPSRVERMVTFSWSLTPAARTGATPDAVSPTGTVTVKEAANCASAPVVAQHQCVATLPASSCQVAFASTGTKSMQLCYSGDSAFAAASATESHDVIAAAVPVLLSQVISRRLDTERIEVRFQTAANVGTTAFDIAVEGVAATLPQRGSRGEDGRPLQAASALLASSGDAARAADYVLEARVSGAQFWLRGYGADRAIESFGPFTVGSSSGADSRVDAAAVDWGTLQREAAAAAGARTQAGLRAVRSTTGAYLKVAQPGVQRISQAQLASAGVTAFDGMPVAQLALSTVLADGQSVPVPLTVESADALFNAGDAIVFIGEPADTQYSGERWYTLQTTATAARIGSVNAAPGGTGEPARTVVQSRTLRERKLFSPTSAGDSPWTWLRLASTGSLVAQAVTLDLPNLTPAAGELRLRLHGGVDHDGEALDHHLDVLLNGQALGAVRFDGVRVYDWTVSVPAGVLLQGANQLELRLPGDTGLPSDVVSLEAVTVTGVERLQAVSGRLDVRPAFQVQGGTPDAPLFAHGFEDESATACGSACPPLAVAGLGADAVFYRVRGSTVERLDGASFDGIEWRLHAAFGAQDRLLGTTGAARHLPALAAVPDSSTLLAGSADWLAISHPQFADALSPLLAARAAQGLTTKLVTTDAVYAAYSGGEPGHAALERYLRDARQALGTRMVLLVGGDTLDARGFQGTGSLSFVPTRLAQTSNLVRFAPSDPALADTDADGVPDLAIGRLPVRSGAELGQVLAKLLAPVPANQRALLVADGAEPGLDFAEIQQGLGALLPQWQVRQAPLDLLGMAATQQAILDEANAGTRLIQYFGHAAPARWSFNNLLTASQLQSGVLSNGSQPTRVLQWACWTNYFIEPSQQTLGHAWLNQSAGASLVLGPSTLTETAHDEALARRLLPLLSVQGGLTIGEALQQAKRQLATEVPGQVDVQLGVSLLGDPASR